MRKYKSVRTKLVMVISFAVLSTAILCIGINVYNFSKYYREAIDGKINASAQSVIKTINELLKSGSLGSSGVIMDWIKRDCEKAKASDKDILYLAVTDTKGLVHYHTENRYMNKTFEQAKNVIDKAYPIKNDGEDANGILHIGIEKATINKNKRFYIRRRPYQRFDTLPDFAIGLHVCFKQNNETAKKSYGNADGHS